MVAAQRPPARRCGTRSREGCLSASNIGDDFWFRHPILAVVIGVGVAARNSLNQGRNSGQLHRRQQRLHPDGHDGTPGTLPPVGWEVRCGGIRVTVERPDTDATAETLRLYHHSKFWYAVALAAGLYGAALTIGSVATSTSLEISDISSADFGRNLLKGFFLAGAFVTGMAFLVFHVVSVGLAPFVTRRVWTRLLLGVVTVLLLFAYGAGVFNFVSDVEYEANRSCLLRLTPEGETVMSNPERCADVMLEIEAYGEWRLGPFSPLGWTRAFWLGSVLLVLLLGVPLRRSRKRRLREIEETYR